MPGYGNAELKKKDMKPSESGGLSIMVEKKPKNSAIRIVLKIYIATNKYQTK